MKESSSNWGFVHEDCVRRNPEHTARAVKDPHSLIGHHIKRAFPAKRPNGASVNEHMWVRVTGVRDGQLLGIVDNDPVYDCEWKDGSSVEFAPESVDLIA